jgi:hypothetical protein
MKSMDIRTLPFIRFQDNESHCQRRHAFNLGGGVPFGKPNVDGVGPDEKHPFIVQKMRLTRGPLSDSASPWRSVCAPRPIAL